MTISMLILEYTESNEVIIYSIRYDGLSFSSPSSFLSLCVCVVLILF